MRLGIPDLISNSYFPAIAAVELGFMAEEGVDATLELVFPVTDAAAMLERGELDLLAGAAHAPLYAAPRWGTTKLLAALAHNMYWFLVVRADSPVRSRGRAALAELGGALGMRIGAAPGPDLGLRRCLAHSGIDVESSSIQVGPVPGADGDGVSFGVTAARALAEGRIDAFWANGMGAEVAVEQGIGRVVYDARRDGGAPATYTFPALMATARTIEQEPESVAAAVRAIVRTQDALRQDVQLARRVGTALFPSMEAGLIDRLIERDLPYYSARIDETAVSAMNDFAAAVGLADSPGSYEDAVATELAPLWTE